MINQTSHDQINAFPKSTAEYDLSIEKENTMSMRGEIISGEYKKMVWVHDKEGKEYACYVTDPNRTIKNKENLTETERKTCLDLNTVLGDNW